MRRIRTLASCVMCAFTLMSSSSGTTSPGSFPVAGAQRADSAKTPSKTRSVTRCVRYSQRQGEADLELKLDNRCGLALTCTMQWSLACEREDGSIDEYPESQTFDLFKRDVHAATASAARCGDDAWRVEDVRWTCRSGEEETKN